MNVVVDSQDMTAEMLKRPGVISGGSQCDLRGSDDRNALSAFLKYSVFAVIMLTTAVVCVFEVIQYMIVIHYRIYLTNIV